MEIPPLPPGGLAAALLAASDWCNDVLVARLVDRGWPGLNRTQSQVFAALGGGASRPAELARRVGVTRQSMQVVLRGLVGEDLLAVHDDPHDRRSLVVHLTPRGRRLVEDAEEILVDLEHELARRMGQGEVDTLRGALGRWRAVVQQADGGSPGG